MNQYKEKLIFQDLITDQSQLPEVASKIVSYLKPGTSLALSGELGSGKTTLTAEICRQLNCLDPVSSPTYVLEQRYQTNHGILISHWDLYRLKAVPEELLIDPEINEIRIVEWADLFPEVLAMAEFSCSILLEDHGRIVKFY